MKSGYKNQLKSIINVFASNIATIISGIFIGFIIPKVTDVEGYGYYKTFTLYVAYAGLFSLGIIDGIVLDYGGVEFEEYNRPFFRSIFKWYLLIHFLWTSFLFIISFFFHDSNYSFVVIMIAINIIFCNLTGYFQQISQITQRFKEYSSARIIQSLMKIMGGVIMLIIYIANKKHVDYRFYVLLSNLGFVIVTIGYLVIYRDIVFGASYSLGNTRNSVISLSKKGFPLLIANLCSTLILTLDRQFVNLLFPNTVYAGYAFSYNLLSLITVATSAVSTVLYPVLKRTTIDKLKNSFSCLISCILVFVFFTLLSYFPLCWFIGWFLPQYNDSLVIFRIIFPGLAISSAITVVMHNYYKTFDDNFVYFRKSLLILVVSFFANTIAYVLFKSTISISAASIVTMVIWYIYIEQYFVNRYKYSRWRNLCYLLIMMSSFYLSTSFSNLIVSGFVYFVAYIIFTYTLQRNALVSAKQFVK